MDNNELIYPEKILERISSGEIRNQKCWKFIKELNSWSEECLNRIALINGKRSFTYRQLFRQWDRYAEVFFAMKITGKNGSRAAMVGNVSAECIIAFYALNMVSVPVSMLPVEETHDENRFLEALRKEAVTDLIIAETYAWPGLLRLLYFNKKELGLNNIIILPTCVDGDYAAPLERLQAWTYDKALKLYPDMERMDTLIKEYEATPFTLGVANYEEPAVITHTSGTTRGIHKPIPLSDRALNAAAVSLMQYEPFRGFPGSGVTAMTKEMTATYGMVDMVHVPLALGCTNVIIPMGGYNPQFYKAIPKYKINILLSSAQQFEVWMRCPGRGDFDFSSLEFITLGGAYISPDRLKKINTFIKDHGGTVNAVSGYGLSEAGGACILPDVSLAGEDVIGRPLPGVDVKIRDEEDQKFYDIEDGPRTGGLYISSAAISSGRIGEKIFFEPEVIDGKSYIPTNDQVEVREDGNLTYAGRTNRYFVNNEGCRFDAGIIETALSKQPGIEGCAVVPEYSKEVYDTIPVLYIQTCRECGFGHQALNTVKEALLKTFSSEENFDRTQLPAACVLTRKIPYNATGKVDTHKIATKYIDGIRYTVNGICRDGKLCDIQFLPANKEDCTMDKNMFGNCGNLFNRNQAEGFGCDDIQKNFSQMPCMKQEEESRGFGCDQQPRGFGCDDIQKNFTRMPCMKQESESRGFGCDRQGGEDFPKQAVKMAMNVLGYLFG